MVIKTSFRLRARLSFVLLYGVITHLISAGNIYSQTIGAALPAKPDKQGRYLFYLHAGVVSLYGNNAINRSMPQWGPYEYLNILDSLKSRRFNVISERRFDTIPDSVYAAKIRRQIDTLLQTGVRPARIMVVGASSGWNIVLQVSSICKNNQIKYVIMGGCWQDDYKDYASQQLYGNFLSIIEKTDPHGSCAAIFVKRKNIKKWNEIVLNTGLNHGFIYKGLKEWIDPIRRWAN